jgi:spermidine/putrescine transport system ATP-binding protein
MRAELRAIQKRTGVTFIYITHDQGEALAMSDRVGVMSQGVLQQVGTPMEIYNTPANGFVASFVGENNVFSGTVKSVKAGVANFETSAGSFATRLGLGVKTGDMAKLYVRPEHSSLQRAALAKGNNVPVEVSEVAFEGNFVNVFARDKFATLHMVQAQNDPNLPPPAVGAKMNMTFSAENAVVLADAVVNSHG